MRRRSVAIFIVLAIVALSPAPARAEVSWSPPVPGPVVRPFRAPLTRYGAGHLGVDFAALPGTPVRTAGAGTVVFAGVVAKSRHVVVRHPGDLRTSYSFLASIRVHKGDVVDLGTVLGTAGGKGENHEPGVLHFGLRIGEQFVDPMQLFAAPDLAALVHLAPVPGGPAPTLVPQGEPPDELRVLAASLAGARAPLLLSEPDPVPLCVHLAAVRPG